MVEGDAGESVSLAESGRLARGAERVTAIRLWSVDRRYDRRGGIVAKGGAKSVDVAGNRGLMNRMQLLQSGKSVRVSV